MSDTLKLAIQLTAVDMMSGVLARMKTNVLGLGDAGKQVARDFDRMEAHVAKGLKATAVSLYGMRQMAKGITPAADLQEAIIDVKMNLMESGKEAKVLDAELAKVRATAVEIQKISPFSAQDVVGIENTFLKAGLKFNDVTAQGGATWAATALATIAKVDPATIANDMVTIATPFKIKGSEYGDLANFLQKVDTASVTTIPELAEGAKYVAGTAAKMKLSYQEMFQGLGVLAQQGIRGSMGGTAFNDFLVRLVGASHISRKVLHEVNAELKKQGKDPLEFWDKKGKLKSMPVIINNLQQSLKGFTDKEQLHITEKFFGEQGARAASAFAQEDAWKDVGKSIATAVSLQEKMNERMKGFNANVTSLGGTTKTTLATLFDPMLGGLTAVTQKLNDVVDLTGQLAAKHPDLTRNANYLAAGTVGAAGLYGAYHLAKGGFYGARVLNGLRGMGGTALGVAEGKALEATMGVKPVFVTNWPGSFGGTATSGALTDTAVTGAAVAATAGMAGAIVPMVVAGVTASGVSMVRDAFFDKDKDHSSAFAGFGADQGDTAGLRALFSNIFQQDRQPPKNEINMNISVDQNGRTTAQTNDPNTTTRINTLKRGNFADANNF